MSEQKAKSFWERFFTLFIVGGFLLGFFYLVMMPALLHRAERRTSPASACINNLRQIDAAANQFALEHRLTNGSRINFPNDLMPYMKLNREGKIPSCPSGGIYRGPQRLPLINPTCSLGSTVTPAHILP